MDRESDGMGLNRLFNKIFISLLTLLLLVAGTGCATPVGQQNNGDGQLKVVATTTIVGDVVSQVGGEHVALDVLLPVGADPHSYDPAPRDVVKIANADVIFASGLGLETFLETLIENAGSSGSLIEVSEGIELLEADGDSHEHEDGDPHTWTDPNNVMVWVEVIVSQLSKLDPDHAADYAANAAVYTAELVTLDAWVVEQVAQVPEANRKIVADHNLYSYFANRYGFTQVGAIIPGYSTLAEPSVKELAALQDTIAEVGVRAIFVGNAANPVLSERVAEDTGVELVVLYTGSLTEAGGDAPTYVEYIKYNVGAIVGALK
jgi:manganese/iron transport system substrate-binding protein